MACFDGDGSGEVYIIHDFSTWGYKNRRVFKDFEEWFKQCVCDMFEYVKEEIEYYNSEESSDDK